MEMVIEFKNLKINNLHSESEFENKVIFFLKNWYSSSKTVQVQTSGSTGTPKLFDVEKIKMEYSARMTCDFLKLEEGDTALLCLPVEYISGKMMLVRSIIRKLKLYLVKPSSSPLSNLEVPIDFCAMTPLQVENSLDKLSFVKNIIIGGAGVSEQLQLKIATALNNQKFDFVPKVFETYGMSETLSHIGLKQLYPQKEDYFTLFEGISISNDDRGCLQINAPQLNKELLQTNDLVEIINERHFRFLGRIDNVINSGGAKIFPEQLESLVKKIIPNEVVFMGLTDDTFGERLIAIVEGEESEDLKLQIMGVPFGKSYHKPKEIYFVKMIPRTPNGKVNRLELKKLFHS